jgi:tripartite ATP-independent transporter DctP family solute receptor
MFATSRLKTLLQLSVLSAAACLAGQAAAQQLNMRLGHELPLNTPIHEALTEFSANVKTASNGRINIRIFGGGSLGADRALSEQVRLGGIELAALGINTQAVLNQDFSVDEVPYAWDSFAQLQAAFDGGLGRIFSEKFIKLGARPLGFFPFGFRHLTNNVRPVTKPDDLKGLKLRMAEVPIRMDTFRTLGAQPIPIAFPELFTSLQQGVVDGQENPLFIIRGGRFFEVQKHLTLTRHIAATYWLVMNEARFQAAPKDLRDIMLAEAAKIAPKLTKVLEEGEAQDLQFLKNNGMQVVENIDRDAFRTLLKPVYETYKTKFSPELWAIMEKHSSIK